jgi:hypothetical protein
MRSVLKGSRLDAILELTVLLSVILSILPSIWSTLMNQPEPSWQIQGRGHEGVVHGGRAQ